MVSNADLIQAAERALNPQPMGTGTSMMGEIGAALATPRGEIYTGVSIGSYLGICAEQSAAGHMISNTGPRIAKMVAVRRDEGGQAQVIAPCGRCREFVYRLVADNRHTQVLLSPDRAVLLQDLLPNAVQL